MSKARVETRVDKFIMVESLMEWTPLLCQWIGVGGESDPPPIFLELRGNQNKISSPFKCNFSWVKNEHSLYFFFVKKLIPFNLN